MIMIITKKKYNAMVAELEELKLIQERHSDSGVYAWLAFDKEKEKVKKYQKLYTDELQKRLELAEIVKRLENDHK